MSQWKALSGSLLMMPRHRPATRSDEGSVLMAWQVIVHSWQHTPSDHHHQTQAEKDFQNYAAQIGLLERLKKTR